MLSIRSIIKNSTYNIGYLIIHTVIYIIATPLLMGYLGVETYGLWITTTSILSLMGVLDLGFSTTVTKYVAEYRIDNNKSGIFQVMVTVVLVYFLIGSLASIMMFHLSPFLANILKLPDDLEAEAVLMFKISAMGILPNLLRGPFLGVCYSYMRYDLANILRISYILISMVGVVIIAILGGGGVKVTLWSVISLWIMMIIIIFVAIHLIGRLPFRVQWNYSRLKEILKYSGFISIVNVSGFIFLYLDRLIVGILLGTSAVAYYTIGVSIASKINQLAAAASHVVLPAVSAMQSQSNEEFTYLFIKRSTKIMSVFVLFIGSIAYILCDQFLTIWLGEQYIVEITTITRWLIVAYSLFSLNAIPFNAINGIGKPEIIALIQVITGSLTIVLVALLTRVNGLLGSAQANLAMLVNLFLNIYIVKKYQQPLIRELWNSYAYALITFIISISFYNQTNESLIGLIASIIICCFLFGGIIGINWHKSLSKSFERLFAKLLSNISVFI